LVKNLLTVQQARQISHKILNAFRNYGADGAHNLLEALISSGNAEKLYVDYHDNGNKLTHYHLFTDEEESKALNLRYKHRFDVLIAELPNENHHNIDIYAGLSSLGGSIYEL
jgi:hypothetical protein